MEFKGHYVICQLCYRKRHVEDIRQGYGENRKLIVCKEHYMPFYPRDVKHLPVEKPAQGPFNSEPLCLGDGSNDSLLAAPRPTTWDIDNKIWDTDPQRWDK